VNFFSEYKVGGRSVGGAKKRRAVAGTSYMVQSKGNVGLERGAVIDQGWHRKKIELSLFKGRGGIKVQK